jgi:hypothetical protein
MKLYMFRTVPLSNIRSFSLYTQQWYMSYSLTGSLRAGSVSGSWSCSQASCQTVWHIPLLCVQWKTPDVGQRNCPKHVEFHSKNNFEKLVYLVGFIIQIYHDARSHEYQIPSTHKTGGWTGLLRGVDVVAKRKSSPCRRTEPCFTSSSVA